MITGVVNSNREPVIIIIVLGPGGVQIELEAIVDTGFNGSLTLPTELILELGLPWQNRGSAILANGMIDECDIYAGKVVWDGKLRSILVEASDTNPLVGMGLIYGSELVVLAVDGGEVTIELLGE